MIPYGTWVPVAVWQVRLRTAISIYFCGSKCSDVGVFVGVCVSVFVAPNMASSPPKSSPRLDDASTSYLARAEAIIQDQLGDEELSDRQQNQAAAFKVQLVSDHLYSPYTTRWIELILGMGAFFDLL